MTPRPSGNRRSTNVRQRKKQQHLLDVKVRASTERRRRLGRIFTVTFRLILFTALIAGSWIGGKEALRRFVWENPDYAIHEIKVVTDGALTREQLISASGLSEGRNIFLINLGQARAALEKLPQVESAEVTRTLPNRLAINVTERQPIAWAVWSAQEDPTSSDSAFLVDVRGVLMKPKVKLEEYLHLPVISGVQTGNLVAGERVTIPEMQSALELIRLTSESSRYQARHVDISKGYCLVVTDHRHSRITFGLDRIEAQVERLHRYLARAAEDQKEIQTINLLVERNTPVTFVEPVVEGGAEIPPTSKPPETKGKTSALAEKSKAAIPVARALPLATPAPIAPAATPAMRNKFGFKSKGNSTPAPESSDSPHRQPFHLH